MNSDRRVLNALLVTALLCAHGTLSAQDEAQLSIAATVGRAVSDVIDDLRRAGMPFAYSTSTLPPNVTVQATPVATDPVALVREILAPHGLDLRSVDSLYVVVRAASEAAAARLGSVVLSVRNASSGALIKPTFASPSAGLSIETLDDWRLLLSGTVQRRYGITLEAPGFEPTRVTIPIEAAEGERTVELEPSASEPSEVVVTASRYEILRERVVAPFAVDQRSLYEQPDFGDDPLRALHRLPGAASGVSAKAYVRGGEMEETAIVLNGQRLLDPFHIRDYQSLFSAIDARAIEGLEVYTGGFPVRYGNKMSGLVLVEPLSPNEPSHTELGVSVLGTTVLSAGTIGDGTGTWVVSGRRGNLDQFVEERLGEPTYYDLFAELAVVSGQTRVSVNALSARDRVLLVTEPDPAELEQSTDDTRNTHLWIHWEQQWSDALKTSTTFSGSSFESTRIGAVNDPEKIIAAVDDRRDVSVAAVKQDWQLALGASHTLSWGIEYESSSAKYEYSGTADYFGFYTAFTVPPAIRREAELEPDGSMFAVYMADRWEVGSATTLELGARLDKQTYTATPNERQLSPRVSVLHRLGSSTSLRFALGRYHQSQGIHEVQVEDGITDFFPTQRADHAVIGVQRLLADRLEVRAEAYWKSLRDLRPRFENLFDPLALLPELEPDRVRIAPSKAAAHGIELSISSPRAEPFRWWASYVLARAEDRVDGRDAPRSWDQRHAVELGLTRETGYWSFGAALSAHTGWPTTALELDSSDPSGIVAVPGERNALRLGAFGSLDFRASRKVPLRIGSLDVFVEVSNATARENPCCIEFDLGEAPDGTPTLEQDTDTWLPRLATFGVLWEF